MEKRVSCCFHTPFGTIEPIAEKGVEHIEKHVSCGGLLSYREKVAEGKPPFVQGAG